MLPKENEDKEGRAWKNDKLEQTAMSGTMHRLKQITIFHQARIFPENLENISTSFAIKCFPRQEKWKSGGNVMTKSG